MKTEKEIRGWIAKLDYQIKELESQLNRRSSFRQQEIIGDKVAEKQIERFHYQKCLGDV